MKLYILYWASMIVRETTIIVLLLHPPASQQTRANWLTPQQQQRQLQRQRQEKQLEPDIIKSIGYVKIELVVSINDYMYEKISDIISMMMMMILLKVRSW